MKVTLICLGMYVCMYKQKSQRISYRVKYALKSRAEKRLFKGSITPYAYYYKYGKLFIINDFTPSGVCFNAIARGLYNDDIPSPSQVTWFICKMYFIKSSYYR